MRQKQYEYPVTYQLIKDGRKNKVLSKKINLKLNVTMIHGQKDERFSFIFTKGFVCICKGKKKNGYNKKWSHSLSSKKNLTKIKKELDKLIRVIFNLFLKL